METMKQGEKEKKEKSKLLQVSNLNLRLTKKASERARFLRG